MTDHETQMIRARKDRIAHHLHEAHNHLSEILWIHPNGDPVYLDYDQAQGLRELQRLAGELLERHEIAEEGLKAAARRVA